MRQSGADAQSKDTTFAGLPKAIKLVMLVNDNAPAAGVDTILRYDTIAFNYGAFLPDPNATAGLFQGVLIQEPGVYEVLHHYAWGGGTGGQVYTYLTVNGSKTLPDGSSLLAGIGFGGEPGGWLYSMHWKGELKAGDVVQALQNQAGVATIVSLARYGQLYVEKKGGQY